VREANPDADGRTCHKRMHRVLPLIVCGVLLCPAGAKADNRRRFAVDYRGPASCPTEGALLAEVRRRAPSAEPVTVGPREVSAQLRVEAIGGRHHGTIDIESRDGLTHREVEAQECAEVLRALALILAIAIDPDAISPAPVPASSGAPDAFGSPPRARLPSVPRSVPLSWAAGGSIGLAGGVAPSPSFTQALFAELRHGRDAGFSAHIRLSGVHAHGAVSARAGSADFDLLALRLASCPYRVGTLVALTGCGSFDFGRLQGRGSHTQAEQTSSALWFGPGAFIDAEFRVLPWFRVQVEAGALLPLARDSFYFGPAETVHRIPVLAGWGGLNLLVGG
jgi:hypothetical protein